MAIPPDHEHVWQPFAVKTLDDGKVISSRCQCDPTLPQGAMEQRMRVAADGRVVSLQYRYGGMWFDPLDLLRMRPSVTAGRIDFCPSCEGRPSRIQGLGPCPRCNGIGVTVDGEAVVAPVLR